MNFDYSEEQQLLAASVRRFVEKQYDFDARKKIIASRRRLQRRASGRGSPKWVARACPLPVECGGFGGGAVDLMSVMEAFGEALVVEPYLSTVLCARVHRARGQRRRRSRRCCPRSSPASSSWRSRRPNGTRATTWRTSRRVRAKDGGGYVLDGEKCVVLHAPCADRLIVSARTSGGDADAAGHQPVRGRRACDRAHTEIRIALSTACVAADVVLRGVRVGGEALLGAEGEALAAHRGGRRLRDRAALRRSGRRDQVRQRRHARIPQDAQAVRRADRHVPGAAAPHGRHGDQRRAGAVDGEPRLRQGRFRNAIPRTRNASFPPPRSRSPMRAGMSPRNRSSCTAAWA